MSHLEYQAASRRLQNELEDHGEDPDDEDLITPRYDARACVTITCETPFNDGPESFELRVTQQPLQPLKVAAQATTPRPKYEPMVTIPMGRPLPAGAKCQSFLSRLRTLINLPVVMFTGTFDTTCRTAATHAIETYGGIVEKSYDVDYVVVGNMPDQKVCPVKLEVVCHADECKDTTHISRGLNMITERQMYTLLQQGIPSGKVLQREMYRFHTYNIFDRGRHIVYPNPPSVSSLTASLHLDA